MSLDHTARLSLPYLAAGQMQKHVTLNEALTRLDALVQCAVASRTTATPPADPPDGLMHIVPEGAAGAWSSHLAGDLVRAESGAWLVVERTPGLAAWVMDENALTVWTGAAWAAAGGLTETLPRLGVNAAPDEVNLFAARLNTALWTALAEGDGGSGDLRYVLNKEGPAKVLSLLMQSGWSGRAELGLVGDDDLAVRVSADGEDWSEAIKIERGTGRAFFAAGAMRTETTVIEASGSYTPPAWARLLRITLVGGGGGGGGGAGGPADVSRSGGGGGGAGGRSDMDLPTEGVAALTVVVGAGGLGGAGAAATGEGATGATGGSTAVHIDGASLLMAYGGAGGGGGGLSNASGGSGGYGDMQSSVGGGSTLTGNGAQGAVLPALNGAAGGGGGGALAGPGAARAGGNGGFGGYVGGPSRRSRGVGGAAGTDGAHAVATVTGALTPAGGGGGGGGATLAGIGAAGGNGYLGGGGGGAGAGETGGGAGGRGGDGRAVIVALG